MRGSMTSKIMGTQIHTYHFARLVDHRTGDRNISIEQARYMVERMPSARLVELPGEDHMPWFGDRDALLGEVEEFLTGVRHEPEPDRVLATVLFTDIVNSTERAAELGDRQWRDLLARHHSLIREELGRFRGREIDTAGDGFLRRLTALREPFTAPGPFGIQ